MFAHHSDDGYIRVSPGITRKTLVYGDKTLMTEFRLSEGADLACHSHTHEQTGYLVSGHMILTIGHEEQELFPGDSWMIPGNIPHYAKILADTIAIEVFSPCRDEYVSC